MKVSSHRPPETMSWAKSGKSKAEPNSGRKRDRAAKQRALTRSALKLFASKGYESTTTREIAATAGCAEGLIHRYFGSKAGLLPALMKYRISQEVADLAEHLPPLALSGKNTCNWWTGRWRTCGRTGSF